MKRDHCINFNIPSIWRVQIDRMAPPAEEGYGLAISHTFQRGGGGIFSFLSLETTIATELLIGGGEGKPLPAYV